MILKYIVIKKMKYGIRENILKIIVFPKTLVPISNNAKIKKLQ
ncbi:hypothetical protein [Clostridium autoethanogenum]|nr:hypothetical protein [Clostridium autoethanogenum]